MPKLDDSLLKRLNQQVANELHAAHQYLAMAAHFEAEDLPGCAQWMLAQSAEERDHAMRFFDHINDRDAKVHLTSIDEPQNDFESPVDVFQHALDHERKVTSQIYELYDAAQEQKDHALKVFLDWFVTEQVEEENTVEAVVEKFKRVGDDPTGLMLLDNELGSRTAAAE